MYTLISPTHIQIHTHWFIGGVCVYSRSRVNVTNLYLWKFLRLFSSSNCLDKHIFSRNSKKKKKNIDSHMSCERL